MYVCLWKSDLSDKRAKHLFCLAKPTHDPYLWLACYLSWSIFLRPGLFWCLVFVSGLLLSWDVSTPVGTPSRCCWGAAQMSPPWTASATTATTTPASGRTRSWSRWWRVTWTAQTKVGTPGYHFPFHFGLPLQKKNSACCIQWWKLRCAFQ